MAAVTSTSAPAAPVDQNKPPHDSKTLQTKQDINQKSPLVVNIEAVQKPANSNKLQELEAMEEALKKATEEAH